MLTLRRLPLEDRAPAHVANEPQPCPAGFATAEVLATQVPLPPITRQLPCTADQGALVVDQLPGWHRSSWKISVRIRDGAAGEVFGESTVEEVFPNGTPIDSFHTIVTDAD